MPDRPKRKRTKDLTPATIRSLVSQVRATADGLEALTDSDLREQADALRANARQADVVLDARALSHSFALATAAIHRTTGLRLFDVQLHAGLVLAQGRIAEMQTGEGKTLTAMAPAFAHSLFGRGVHLATVNHYLAQRDFEQLRAAYELLGCQVGLLTEDATPEQKRAVYALDVVYAPGYQFGFDYLRDQVAVWEQGRLPLGARYLMTLRGHAGATTERLQREAYFAIIDEVDSVLIDEARTPLVLSAAPTGADEDPTAYFEAHRVAVALNQEEDFQIDPRLRQARLTDDGAAIAESARGRIAGMSLLRPWHIYVENALQAQHVLQLDVDYVVVDKTVQIVDESTGRIFADRSWRDGLHQAVEAKEEVPVQPEKVALARITRQRYFGRYTIVAGMTGTASDSIKEFRDLYRLGVNVVPLNKPSAREYLPLRAFRDAASKWNAIADAVVEYHASGRPVLVGTRNIENSERLAEMLDVRGILYRLLNGKQDETEANIIAAAGEVGTVTIATNMAGRGTDIIPTDDALSLGGLHVIGTERHDSRRIDRQLAGRAARQGQPGSCQFFVAADDDLIRRYGRRLAQRLSQLGNEAGEISADVTKEIDKAQRRAEQNGFIQRRKLMQQDNWLESVLETLAKRDEPAA